MSTKLIWYENQVPPLLLAALEYIRYELKHYVAHTSRDYFGDRDFFESVQGFQNEVFSVRGYQQSWEDLEEQPWNFKYKDIEVSWYMHLGKYPTVVNREVTPDEVNELLEQCLLSIKIED